MPQLQSRIVLNAKMDKHFAEPPQRMAKVYCTTVGAFTSRGHESRGFNDVVSVQPFVGYECVLLSPESSWKLKQCSYEVSVDRSVMRAI